VVTIPLNRRCPACHWPHSRSAFKINGLLLLRCRECKSLFLAEVPEQAELDPFYHQGKRYFANPDYPERDYVGYRAYLADRSEIEDKFAGLLAQVERIVSPGPLVDVGAGPGLLVAVAQRRGWDARGLDLNAWAADFAREELGVQVDVGSLEDAELDQESVAAVTMMDLLEHVADADRLIEEVARVTRPGGALAILTPDAGSLATRVLGRRWPEVQRAPEHTVLYSARGLGAMVRRHGFEPVRWHWIGKTSTIGTLVADLSLLAPTAARRLAGALKRIGVAERSVTIDPRAKFCLYARRLEPGTAAQLGDRSPAPPVPRMRKARPGALREFAPAPS
jgi:SAM-dependent methyltransferase